MPEVQPVTPTPAQVDARTKHSLCEFALHLLLAAGASQAALDAVRDDGARLMEAIFAADAENPARGGTPLVGIREARVAAIQRAIPPHAGFTVSLKE